MVPKTHVLVVASQTLDSPELLMELTSRARRGAVRVTLLAPAVAGERERTRERLDATVRWLCEAGIEAEGTIGDAIAMVAVSEAWDPRRYDEVIVATLPESLSRWLRIALPQRVAQLVGPRVHHVICAPSRTRYAEPRTELRSQASRFAGCEAGQRSFRRARA